MRLTIEYQREGEPESRRAALDYEDGDQEVKLSKVPEDQRVDAMVEWFAAQRGIRITSADIDLPDDECRRVVKKLAPAAVSLNRAGAWLAEHAGLRELTIDASGFDWKIYPKLKGLRSLDVTFDETTDVLAAIVKGPPLETLTLRKGLSDFVVPALPSVKSLYLWEIRLAKKALARNPGLEELSLREWGKVVLADLGLPAGIRRLDMETFDPQALDPVAKLTKLEELSVRAPAVTGVKKLAPLSKLRSLSLSARSDETLDVERMVALEELRAYSMTVSGLGACKKLRRAGLSRDDLSPLATCTALTHLWLAQTPKGIALAPLAELPALAWLDLGREYRATAKQLAPLAGKKGLVVTTKLGDLPIAEALGIASGKIKLKGQDDFALDAQPVKAAKGDPGPASSHSFGSPALAAGESWPTCGNCKQPMPCMLQLALPAPWKRLLQLFYCTNTDPHCARECRTYEGVGASMLLRLVDLPKKSTKRVPPPKGLTGGKPKTLSLATAKRDVPGEEDARELGIRDAPKQALAGDKVFGWPRWVQDIEWPSCARCKQQMRLLVQLASNKAVDHQWGDVGVAYVFGCSDHRDALDFRWQSG